MVLDLYAGFVQDIMVAICWERVVLLAFSLSFVILEPRHEKTCLCHMRTTKAQISLRSLISAFAVRCRDSIISLISIFAISGL